MELPSWLSSNNVSAIAAILAIIISIYSIYRGHRAEKKYEPIIELQKRISLLDLQEREQALLNNKKAILKASYNKIGKHNKLRISNIGKCDAKNVNVSTSNKSPVSHRELNTFNELVMIITSMGHYEFIASNNLDTPSHDTITIKWDDDEEKNKSQELIIKTY